MGSTSMISLNDHTRDSLALPSIPSEEFNETIFMQELSGIYGDLNKLLRMTLDADRIVELTKEGRIVVSNILDLIKQILVVNNSINRDFPIDYLLALGRVDIDALDGLVQELKLDKRKDLRVKLNSYLLLKKNEGRYILTPGLRAVLDALAEGGQRN